MLAMLGDKKLKYKVLSINLSNKILRQYGLLYSKEVLYKEHLIMEKNSNAFDGMQNDEVMKEITCAIISVSFISWFTCAVVGSFRIQKLV